MGLNAGAGTRSVWCNVAAWCVGGALLLAGGCSEPQRAPESDYLITFDQAAELGYGVAWQSRAATTSRGRVTDLQAYDDLVVTTEDGFNVVSVMTARDGQPVWDEPVGDRLERLMGVTRAGETFVAGTQSDLYLLDVATGRVIAHQRYAGGDAAGSPPYIYDPFAIYGTGDGRIVYHHLGAGLSKQAYRLDAPVDMAPFPVGDLMGVITRAGTIHLMNPANNTRLWVNSVLDPVVAEPAVDDRHIYIAGTDQSVWAFRIRDGRQAWRYRAQRSLTDRPTVIGDTLYVAIPGQGLAALNTDTGQPEWIGSDVQGGVVLTQTGEGNLIVWDVDDGSRPRGSTFYRVDSRNGDVMGSFRAERIVLATADSMSEGNIYGATRSGRVIKLVP